MMRREYDLLAGFFAWAEQNNIPLNYKGIPGHPGFELLGAAAGTVVPTENELLALAPAYYLKQEKAIARKQLKDKFNQLLEAKGVFVAYGDIPAAADVTAFKDAIAAIGAAADITSVRNVVNQFVV